MVPPPKEQLLYVKPDSNQSRTKLPTTVKVAVTSHTKLLLYIYKSDISYLVLKFTSLSTRASGPSSG